METPSLELIHKDMINMQRDIRFIRHVLEEDFELSQSTKDELAEARKTLKGEFISQADMEKEFLR